MGNKYHLIACSLCGIIFTIELVEGENASIEELNAVKFTEKEKNQVFFLDFGGEFLA